MAILLVFNRAPLAVPIQAIFEKVDAILSLGLKDGDLVLREQTFYQSRFHLFHLPSLLDQLSSILM